MPDKKPNDCTTVAELIELLLSLRSPPKEDGTLQITLEESTAEEAVGDALAYYGPMLWQGYIWWSYLAPRDRRVNRVKFNLPQNCPWPPDR